MYIAVAKINAKLKIIIRSDGLSGEYVVNTLNAVARVTTRKPAGGLKVIQKIAVVQKIIKVISVPFKSSSSNQLNWDGVITFVSLKRVG